jgi:signal transduction histidine kinase
MQLIMDAKLASLGAMVAGIAHEIRNPLNFMINFAAVSEGLTAEVNEIVGRERARLDPDALAELEDALTQLRESSGRISEHGRRADAIIQSMLQHARRSPGPREAGNLNKTVAKAVRLARGGARVDSLEITIVEAYDPTITALEMAEQDIERVFLNLVDNAIYAVRQKKQALGSAFAPEIRVRTADRGDHVEARIRDNGTGVPKEIVDQIYNPFFTTKPPGQGTGLGLSLSHDIVVQGHRGTMRMESEPGEYTEMIVTLPKAPSSRRD